jgi:hypothetical protein
VVFVLSIGPRVHRFKPGRDDGFLRAIQIRSTTFFGGEVSLPLHVVRFYGMLKIPADYYRDTMSSKFKDLLAISQFRS